MKKITKGLTYFIRILAIILIATNFLRIFTDFKFFFFLQRPPALALFNSVALFLFSYVKPIFKKFKMEISDLLYLLASISVLLTLGLGMIFAFYQTVPFYDSFAHFLNGGLLVLIGILTLSLLVKQETLKQLSPLFIVLFAFMFASTLGIIWELVEYSIDGIFNSNMQRFAEINIIDGVVHMGENLAGREALKDTMIDIILNTFGSLIISVLIYFDLKREHPYINEMYIKRIEKGEELIN